MSIPARLIDACLAKERHLRPQSMSPRDSSRQGVGALIKTSLGRQIARGFDAELSSVEHRDGPNDSFDGGTAREYVQSNV